MAQDNEQHVAGALTELGDALRRQPSVRDAVMRRVTREAATGDASRQRPGLTSRRSLARFAAIAACAVVALLVWSPWGGGGIGAQQAFAAAIAKVEAAGTFACRQIVTEVGADGEPEVHEISYVFQEPNLERIEYGEGLPEQVMITDYAKQARLVVRPDDKVAVLQDLRTLYTTDEETGQVKPTELGTHARDDVLRISARAVKDLGMTKLNGRDVWVLQSDDDGAERIVTVYVTPEDGKPVQVELTRRSSKQSLVYADIQMDTPLDESLFSFEPPEGYAVEDDGKDPKTPFDEMNGKMAAKMMRVVMECYTYMSKHGEKWPAKLDDLTTAGVDAQKLKTLLAAPDSKDGKPVIVYRQPKEGETDAVVVYEAPEFRRGGTVVVGFTDGHVEIVTKKRFAELMK